VDFLGRCDAVSIEVRVAVDEPTCRSLLSVPANRYSLYYHTAHSSWHALQYRDIRGFMERYKLDLTCALADKGTLHHSSAGRSLAEGYLTDDGIFFNDHSAVYTDAIPGRGVVLEDCSSAIFARWLRKANKTAALADDVHGLPLLQKGQANILAQYDNIVSVRGFHVSQ
jgi:hypothetical protein